jgi:hypothetical protein
MVKDSKKYALTGGRGFAQSNENDGKPADEVVLKNLLSLPRGYQSSRLGLHPLLTLILRTTADRNETKTTHKSTAAQTKI